MRQWDKELQLVKVNFSFPSNPTEDDELDE